METTLAAGYVKVHCTDAGSLPVGDVKFKFKETVPFAAAIPEASTSESFCATAAGAKNRAATARVNTYRPHDRVNRSVIGSG